MESKATPNRKAIATLCGKDCMLYDMSEVGKSGKRITYQLNIKNYVSILQISEVERKCATRCKDANRG